MRRANSVSGLAAILLLPVALLGLGVVALVLALPWTLTVPLAAALGALAGVAHSLGGGLTSNVQQPLWLGAACGAMVGVGALAAQVWSGTQSLGWPVLALVGLGVVGGAPGALLYALLARLFGRPSVSVEEWRQL